MGQRIAMQLIVAGFVVGVTPEVEATLYADVYESDDADASETIAAHATDGAS